MNSNTLITLAADINAAYTSTNIARIEVGKLLNKARAEFKCDKLFGQWCAENIHADLSHQARGEMMAVAKYVGTNSVEPEVISNLGWSGLVSISRIMNGDIGEAARRAGTEAINEAAFNGKLTAAEAVQVAAKAMPGYAKSYGTVAKALQAATPARLSVAVDEPVTDKPTTTPAVTASEVMAASTMIEVAIRGYGITLQVERTASGYEMDLPKSVRDKVIEDFTRSPEFEALKAKLIQSAISMAQKAAKPAKPVARKTSDPMANLQNALGSMLAG